MQRYALVYYKRSQKWTQLVFKANLNHENHDTITWVYSLTQAPRHREMMTFCVIHNYLFSDTICSRCQFQRRCAAHVICSSVVIVPRRCPAAAEGSSQLSRLYPHSMHLLHISHIINSISRMLYRCASFRCRGRRKRRARVDRVWTRKGVKGSNAGVNDWGWRGLWFDW